MKRYHYKKWFCKLMNVIPIRIVRVLVAFFMQMGMIIYAAISAFIGVILEHFNTIDMKGIFGDVWNWNERGEKYDGYVGGH